MHINREKAKTGTKWAAGVGGWATAAVLALKMGLSGPAPLPPEQVAQQPQERPVAVRVLSADEAASTLTLKFPGPEELDRVKDGAPITFEPVAAADAAPPVPEPVPAPGPAPDAAAPVAPDAAGAGPKPILGEVDGMLGDGPGPQFFDNVDGALTKMLDGLKGDRDLAKDPQFWVRLGMLYGSTGQKKLGDWEGLTEEQRQDKLRALGCFNHAHKLDPSVNDQVYGPAGATVANAYKGTRDKMGVKADDAAKLDVAVTDDGTVTLVTPPTTAPPDAAAPVAPDAAAPVAPDAAAPVAPDAAGAGPKPILGEVDGMLGDGPGPQFFDNVDGAVTKLKDGLKADPELAKDPQFWVRLAMTLSSTGQKGPGDWEGLTDQQKQDKKDALGAFNTAYELDPGVNNQRYGPAGATVADAYRGTRDKMGVKPGEAAALRLTADDAGNLTLGTKTE